MGHRQRVLPVRRYSGDDDAGALSRQQAAIEAWLAEQGEQVQIVDWVTDETVSGGVNLDERPALGSWLREPGLNQWDLMVVTTQDRITRDDMHWWQFVGNLVEWDKRLVVLDDPGLDLDTPNGRILAGLKATQAANYRLDVKKKAQAARASFRQQRRYAGGHWPYGHRAEPREGQEGWRLVPDPETSERVREAVKRIIEGESLRGVARDWTNRGVPTARQHQAMTRILAPGETRAEPRQYVWNETTLKRVLQSPTLLGYASHRPVIGQKNGKNVYGEPEIIREDGIPVQWADPIISVDEYRKVQEILSSRLFNKQRVNRSPFLGVLSCPCGQPMHFKISNGHEYYRCGSVSRSEPCEGIHTHWPVQMIKDYLEDRFYEDVGDNEIKTKTFIPGSDNTAEIATLTSAIEHLSGNLATLPTGSRAANMIIDKIAEHEQRLDELESQPSVPASYELKGTGETFRERWDSMNDWVSRGAWLMRAGFRVTLGGSREVPNIRMHVPESVEEHLQRTL